MTRLLIFLVLSIPVIAISWRTIFNIKSHGFYRFFSWECIIWLLASNYSYWFVNPFSVSQIFSWILLFTASYFVIAGAILLKKKGKPKTERDEKALYQFEKTTELIEDGIFGYIRHPLYSSLVLLTWGIYLKNTTVELFIVSALSTVFLYITALFDEKECITYFGDKYVEYMKKSKRFIPFIF